MQTGGLVGNLLAHDSCPRLLGDRARQVQLQAQPARGARMRQKRQEHAAGMMRVARGEQADAIFTASGKHRMGECYFAVIEHNHCDVLERHEGGLLLLNSKAKLLAPQLGWA